MGISFRDVRVGYKNGNFSLHVNEMCISEGTVYFLRGRSGCGKTTLLNALNGSLEFFESDNVSGAFSSMGYVMHESGLFPWLRLKAAVTVEEKLRSSLCNRRELERTMREFGLDETLLDDLGLVAALRWMADNR